MSNILNSMQAWGQGIPSTDPTSMEGLYLGGMAGGNMPLAAPKTPDLSLADRLKEGGFGLNVDTAKLGLGALATGAQLWNAFGQLNLAKKQFKFQKQFAETNLANSMKSYNTTLADRARSRSMVEGTGPVAAQQYIDENKLTR